MSPFYTSRFSEICGNVLCDIIVCTNKLDNIAKDFQAGNIKAAVARRAVLTVVADFKKATRNYSRVFRAAYNLTGSTTGDVFNLVGVQYTEVLRAFYKSYSYFEI